MVILFRETTLRYFCVCLLCVIYLLKQLALWITLLAKIFLEQGVDKVWRVTWIFKRGCWGRVSGSPHSPCRNPRQREDGVVMLWQRTISSDSNPSSDSKPSTTFALGKDDVIMWARCWWSHPTGKDKIALKVFLELGLFMELCPSSPII